MINGVHHIALKARDEVNFEEVLAFYGETLGCPAVRTWGEGAGRGARGELRNTLLEVFADGAGLPDKGRFAHIALCTDDVDGMIEQMRALGRPILVEPKDAVLGGDYPIRVGFCQGPAGEEVEFFCER